jgi:hypothetical protein
VIITMGQNFPQEVAEGAVGGFGGFLEGAIGFGIDGGAEETLAGVIITCG